MASDLWLRHLALVQKYPQTEIVKIRRHIWLTWKTPGKYVEGTSDILLILKELQYVYQEPQNLFLYMQNLE